MKAAVLKEYGSLPVLEEVAEPTSQDENAILVKPLVSTVKQLDIAKASGKHYLNFGECPAVMGMDGVSELSDGRRVYAQGLTGMLAERALIDQREMIVLPEKLSSEVAAALPNDLIGSDFALRVRAQIKTGDVIFINGATGGTGMMAVQMAKLHGASKIIVTGRNPEKLEKLKSLGADVTISLKNSDEEIAGEIRQAYDECPFDSVIDYLWGQPMELVLQALQGLILKKHLKIISIGEVAASSLSLPSQLLRGKDIEIIGSGIGSISPKILKKYMTETLPEIFDNIAKNGIYIDKPTFKLEQISEAWTTGTCIIQMK